MYCESNRAVLSNEFGGHFPAFGKWLNIGNDKTPPEIYDKPPVAAVQTLIPVEQVLEVEAPALLQNIPVEKVTVRALNTAGQREDTPYTAGNDNLNRVHAMGVVSSFAHLLEHSLKDVCHASTVSKSVSHIDTSQVGNKIELGSRFDIRHSVGPKFRNNPLSPTKTHYVKQMTMAQPNLLSEPTNPHENHQITLSLQSQVPCTPEPILAYLSSLITNINKSLVIEHKTTFPLSHKVKISDTTHLAPVNHTTTPHTPVNQTNSTPETQAEPKPHNQTDPPHDLANQTVPPTNLDNQTEFGNHDLKRKDHPVSPTSIPKKSRFEDACLEVSRSQFGGIQLFADEVPLLHNDEEGYGKSISLAEEAGLHLSPNDL